MIIFLKQRKKTKKKYTQTTKNAIYQVIIKTDIKNYNKNKIGKIFIYLLTK